LSGRGWHSEKELRAASVLDLKTKTMKTKIQIKSIFGKILFEFEKEDNTIKETVLEAIRRSADLQSADLRYANLRSANLRYANLRSANLQYADLRSANLQSANLQSANLQSANLQSANLQLIDIKNLVAQTTVLPEGELIVWKKLLGGLLAKLLIPVKAKRVNAIGYRKCRFEYAEVLAIYDGKKKVKTGISQQQHDFIYEVGKRVTPDSFDPSPLVECSNGINAFITKQEAIDY
jgi:hypothetical protein